MSLAAIILVTASLAGPADDVPAVVGTVVDAQNRPIAGADIYLFDGPPVGRTLALDDATKTRQPPTLVVQAQSNAEGEFSVALPVYMPPVYASSLSWLALAVHKPGLAVKTRLIARYWPSRAAPIRVVLMPPRNNRVQVRSQGGAPVAQARLWVDQIDGVPLPARLNERLSAESDAAGEAELPDVVGEGVRTVRVQSRQFGLQWAALAQTNHAANTVSLSPVGAIRGRLMDNAGAALPATRVRLATWVEPRDELAGGGLAEATTDAEGRFQVPAMAAGILHLAVELPAGSPLVGTFQDTQQLEAGAINNVVVRFQHGVRVRTAVVDLADDGPITGAVVDLLSFGVPRRRLTVECDEAGGFSGYVLPGLVGRAVVLLPPDFYFPAQSMPTPAVPEGAKEITLEPLRVAAGTTLAGQVVDSAGQAVAGAEVVGELPRPDPAMPDNASRVFFALSDRDGNFMLQGVPPNGKLSLTAASVRGVTVAPVEVNVRGADWVTVPVSPESALSASGRAVDAKGRPVAAAAVRIIAETRERRPRASFLSFDGRGQIDTDAEGRFATPKQLSPDRNYGIEIDAPGITPVRTETIDPAVWRTLDFGDIVLSPTPQLRSVAGQVLDEDGKPIGGAVVSQSGDGPRRTRAVCDADGRFRIEGVYEGPAWLFVECEGRRLQGQPIANDANDIRIVLRENVAAEPRRASWAPIDLPGEETVVRALLDDYRARLQRWPDQWPHAGPQWVTAVEAILDGRFDETKLQALLYFANDTELRLTYLLKPEQIVELARAAPDMVFRSVFYVAAADRLAKSPDRQREALAQALLAARAIEQPVLRIYWLSYIAERLFDRGDREAGAALVREARDRQTATPEGVIRSEEWRARIAGALAYVDAPAAFELCEKSRGTLHDWFLGDVACSLAAEDPAAAERAFERMDMTRFEGEGAVQRMGAVDPERAARIARRHSLASARAEGLALVAHAQADVNPELAARLVEEAYQQLGQSLADGTANTPGGACVTAAALLPVAERVAPVMLDHYLARSLAMRPPRPARGDANGDYESTIAGIALAIAPYDRPVARALLEPLAARMRTLSAAGSPSAEIRHGRLWAAFALTDAAWAGQLIETLPAAPPEVAVSPRASAARLVILALLYRGADRGPWIYRQYLGRRHPDLPVRAI
ncbi:MAG TPA: carboxypeptidase-like regulatory domain-containing protein [Pirellulales bacterium]|nr:carboxypeptidase-like regulatory domain-containing protein [Pirellulales bacterium]